jgi:hypothetical protein
VPRDGSHTLPTACRALCAPPLTQKLLARGSRLQETAFALRADDARQALDERFDMINPRRHSGGGCLVRLQGRVETIEAELTSRLIVRQGRRAASSELGLCRAFGAYRERQRSRTRPRTAYAGQRASPCAAVAPVLPDYVMNLHCSRKPVVGSVLWDTTTMAANKKRQPVEFDIQRGFAAHVEANRKAHEWAAICVAYRAAGKTEQAGAAENKAKHWLQKMLTLEREIEPTPSGSPTHVPQEP